MVLQEGHLHPDPHLHLTGFSELKEAPQHTGFDSCFEETQDMVFCAEKSKLLHLELQREFCFLSSDLQQDILNSPRNLYIRNSLYSF